MTHEPYGLMEGKLRCLVGLIAVESFMCTYKVVFIVIMQ